MFECVRRLQPENFTVMFNKLPKSLKSAAFAPPPGVCVDPNNLDNDEQRKAAYVTLHNLRRERCLPLTTPQERQHWLDES